MVLVVEASRIGGLAVPGVFYETGRSVVVRLEVQMVEVEVEVEVGGEVGVTFSVFLEGIHVSSLVAPACFARVWDGWSQWSRVICTFHVHRLRWTMRLLAEDY